MSAIHVHTQFPIFADLVCLYPLQPSLGALVTDDNERTAELVERKRRSAAHSCYSSASCSHVEDHVRTSPTALSSGSRTSCSNLLCNIQV